MSQAFIREGDDMTLPDVGPSIRALTVFLTRENGGIPVYEKKTATHPDGRIIHIMSNGLSYVKNDRAKWSVVE